LTDELADISLIQAFQMLIQLFIDTCSDRLSLSADEIEKLMDAFLLALPNVLRKRLDLCTKN
ncbi:MAG: hypothetical protein ABRQ25_19065, partial [Clostridiaceae bacterium]